MTPENVKLLIETGGLLGFLAFVAFLVWLAARDD